MNTLMSMNPWSILEDLLDANSRAFRTVQARAAGKFPPVNVYRDDNMLIVDVELPGKTAKDIALTLESQAVVIADKPQETEEGKATPKWSRRLELPFRVDASKANAKFTNGILRIGLPKEAGTDVRHIAIAE